jgi:hypothetical protein
MRPRRYCQNPYLGQSNVATKRQLSPEYEVRAVSVTSRASAQASLVLHRLGTDRVWDAKDPLRVNPATATPPRMAAVTSSRVRVTVSVPRDCSIFGVWRAFMRE